MWGLPDSAIYGTYKRVSHGRGGRKRTPSIYRDMDKALTKALYAPKKSKVKQTPRPQSLTLGFRVDTIKPTTQKGVQNGKCIYRLDTNSQRKDCFGGSDYLDSTRS